MTHARQLDPSLFARSLFSGIAANYDLPAQLLSFLQYRRWHRLLLAQLALPRSARVLDMATGTGAIAFRLALRPDLKIVAVDASRAMLLQANGRGRDHGRNFLVDFVEGTAESIPFPDEIFDAVIFSYLLRYVSDVPGTVRELARVLRPNGTMLSLEFAVPRGIFYPLWRLHTGLVLPLAGALLSPGWRRVGAFLGHSIRDFYLHWPERRLIAVWEECGLVDIQARHASLGGAMILSGKKR